MAKRDETITLDPLERLQRRRQHIEFLLRLEFPGTNAPPPPPTISASTTRTSIEVAQANHEAWQRRRDAQDLRRAELSKMTDEQLDVFAERALAKEQERDRSRREKQTPPGYAPDWKFWIHEDDEWQLHDAALLLVNLEPRTGLGLHLKRILRDEYNEGGFVREDRSPEGLSDEGRLKLNQVGEIVRRARVAYSKGKLAIEFSRRIGSDKWHGAVEPRPFLQWALGKGYDVPAALEKLVDKLQPISIPASGSIAETKRRRDILTPLIERAKARTDGSIAAVWLVLREMAIDGEAPFTGGVEGSALIYTNANNKTAKLARDHVRKRLQRFAVPGR